jgi:hypothetical protein
MIREAKILTGKELNGKNVHKNRYVDNNDKKYLCEMTTFNNFGETHYIIHSICPQEIFTEKFY